MISVPHSEGIETDNDFYFLDWNCAALMAADGGASISFRKGVDGVIVHIIPSNTDFRQQIIDNILYANRMLGIKIIFSKSLSISKTISFSVAI